MIVQPTGTSESGSITAVSRIPNSIEIFWLGCDGSVWDAYWYDGLMQWYTQQLVPATGASTSGGIASVARIPGSLEIFWVGGDGSIWDAHWYLR